MSAIREVAAASEVVDPSAVEALKVGVPEIEHADEIIADKAMGDDARVIAIEKRPRRQRKCCSTIATSLPAY
jgi:hypothetical protein